MALTLMPGATLYCSTRCKQVTHAAVPIPGMQLFLLSEHVRGYSIFSAGLLASWAPRTDFQCFALDMLQLLLGTPSTIQIQI